jgi:3-deoxy-D-manno-octulosonic acid kinase
VLRANGACTLYAAEALESDVRARGLDRWDAWARALSLGESTSGRGATAVIEGTAGARWRLKAMRRGGRLAGLWRDRYPSPRRLVEALAASQEAHARGVPTARPVALIVERDASGFARGAMAVEEIEGAEDLARRVVRGAVTLKELAAAIAVVRSMHDRGVHHTDLNLGNVLVRGEGGESPDAFIIDFDRATFTEGPLPFGARQAAVRRLERSCAKLTGAPGPLGPDTEDLWYSLYAGGDAELARGFAQGRRAGRLALAVHRLGWRRNAT